MLRSRQMLKPPTLPGAGRPFMGPHGTAISTDQNWSPRKVRTCESLFHTVASRSPSYRLPVTLKAN